MFDGDNSAVLPRLAGIAYYQSDAQTIPARNLVITGVKHGRENVMKIIMAGTAPALSRVRLLPVS
ncbi:hypothetical protein [Agrobacterium rosae]|uniref:hypothetical protein n=1 Tax=Agrobacterium rosae TaxID=1972867 RepID=UPI003BA11A3B